MSPLGNKGCFKEWVINEEFTILLNLLQYIPLNVACVFQKRLRSQHAQAVEEKSTRIKDWVTKKVKVVSDVSRRKIVLYGAFMFSRYL